MVSGSPTITTANFGRLCQQLPSFSPDEFVLVTGGLGYIGSHAALELMKAGYNVIIIDDLSNSFSSVRWRIQQLAAAHCRAEGRPIPQLRFHEADYQSPAMKVILEQYATPSYDGGDHPRSQIAAVIHFAAYKSVPLSILHPLDYYENNVCGLVRFVRLLGSFHIHTFIFSSSATVYGSKANTEKPLREEDVVHHSHDPNRPASVEGLACPYARTKYFCEAILADVAASDPRWRIVVLRYFNPIGCDPSGVLGESPRATPTNLFPVVGQVLTGQRDQLSVFGRDWPTRDGTAIRDYVHVADIARGHVKALEKENTRGEPFRVYNLGSGTGSSVLEVVRSLEAATGTEIPIVWTGRRPGDVGFCVAANARAEKELDWTPIVGIGQSAKDLWNYLLLQQQERTLPAAAT
ncbi:hypothetical protein B0T25DRAFT_511769 [Lasiosphaeria hispida]|uniref:NAD-dependent epimerase/dehydratase domain-containing protein n=1 Tax=Lasiosphaeria hispida TaxID=260671 RepID=A0AAJ0M8V4_9PEZI|nr:hypothetical protein B0T25DRAFT_511769 [Lasiosphaeria hispida]